MILTVLILSIYRDKIGCDIVGAGSPLGCAGNIATNFVAIFIISVTKICAILPNIATKDQKKSFVASGGNIAKIFVTLMTHITPQHWLGINTKPMSVVQYCPLYNMGFLCVVGLFGGSGTMSYDILI